MTHELTSQFNMKGQRGKHACHTLQICKLIKNKIKKSTSSILNICCLNVIIFEALLKTFSGTIHMCYTAPPVLHYLNYFWGFPRARHGLRHYNI